MATGLERMWARLARPVDAVAAAGAMLGISTATARQLLAVTLATSDEAEALVAAIPSLLRSLAVSTTSHPTRCVGEVRGPVLWSETLAARASSPGAGGVFICASPVKAYDTDENRVLVAALHRLHRAAAAADGPLPDMPWPDAATLRRARRIGDAVHRALEHRSLLSVSRVPPAGRMVQKARTGPKAATFRPAVALLQRSWAEVGAADLAGLVDERTDGLLSDAADEVLDLVASGRMTQRLQVVDGTLRSGDFTFRHPGTRTRRSDPDRSPWERPPEGDPGPPGGERRRRAADR